MFRKVNESWARKNVKQKCKEDIVHIGNNWENFVWPSSVVLRNGKHQSTGGSSSNYICNKV